MYMHITNLINEISFLNEGSLELKMLVSGNAL